MAQENAMQHTDTDNPAGDLRRQRPSRKKPLIAIVVSVVLALSCFVVLAFLPASTAPFFASPLKSVLTGLGLLGIAFPFVIAGTLLHRKAARSPYYEEGFIASAVLLFGYVAAIFGLLCVGLSAYALVVRLIGGE